MQDFLEIFNPLKNPFQRRLSQMKNGGWMGLELAIVNDEKYQWRSQPTSPSRYANICTNSYQEPSRGSKALVRYCHVYKLSTQSISKERNNELKFALKDLRWDGKTLLNLVRFITYTAELRHQILPLFPVLAASGIFPLKFSREGLFPLRKIFRRKNNL
jgi:hypothetical protein